MARLTLGTDLNDEDAVVSPSAEHPIWQDLDIAFTKDTGFSFSGLIKALGVLSRWQTVRGREDLHLSYTATPKEIACALSDSANEESDRVVQFLTLQPNEIRRLIGKTIDEGDVPVWDHTKRGHRYTIRPLIPSGEDALTWGAGAAERALGIWTISLKNGYLPADFQWPHVQRIVRSIKENLENSLEDRAGEICSRNAPFVEVGIDFKRRFPKERFEDVGDFDVLAYWPLLNVWLIVECKYNQPPHCLKDARRLRDRIFGTKSDRGQFSKIERRREFLAAKLSRIRVLLGWPSPPTDTSSRIQEVYVSREIYWWMRHPPYPVSTDFVRIDTLDSWLQAHFSAGEEDDIEAN